MDSDKRISISSDGTSDPDLRIKLSKGQFSDFLLRVVKAQRLEKREWQIGFDLTKESIKILIEKLLFQVKRVNDLMHEDVTITATSSRGETIEFSSLDQFLSTEWQQRGEIISCQINGSLVIGFSNPNSLERDYFKQKVNIEFKAGTPGKVLAQVESNDLSWPASIFQLIELCISDLSEQVGGSRNIDSTNVDLPYRLERVTNLLQQMIAPFATGMTLLALFALLAIVFVDRNENVMIYDAHAKSFVARDLNELVSSLGPDEAARLLSTATTLKSAGIPYERKSVATRTRDNIKRLPVATWFTMIFFGSIILFVSRAARRYSLSKIGRIFLRSSAIPARKNLKVSDGIGMSLIIGVVSGLASSYIWSIIYS